VNSAPHMTWTVAQQREPEPPGAAPKGALIVHSCSRLTLMSSPVAIQSRSRLSLTSPKPESMIPKFI
jgi:hypothetical protein